MHLYKAIVKGGVEYVGLKKSYVFMLDRKRLIKVKSKKVQKREREYQQTYYCKLFNKIYRGHRERETIILNINNGYLF